METNRQHRSANVAGTAARLLGALAVLIGGLVHLQLYFDGYRDVPNDNLGRSFLLNAIGSAVLAAALVIRRDAVLRLAGIGLSAGTLIAFWLSRTGDGIFGLREDGLDPSPQGALALVVEIAAIVLLAATFSPGIGAGTEPNLRAAVPVVVAVAVVAVGGAALWARGSDDPPAEATQSAESTTIRIADFAFDPGTMEVPVGTTVEWVNEDSAEHTVVADDDSFRSETLGDGDRFTFTFDEPGTFGYACGIHPTMTASIVVSG